MQQRAETGTETEAEPQGKFGVHVEYAYCDHCGAEYESGDILAYVRKSGSGDSLECDICKRELSSFTRLDDDG